GPRREVADAAERRARDDDGRSPQGAGRNSLDPLRGWRERSTEDEAAGPRVGPAASVSSSAGLEVDAALAQVQDPLPMGGDEVGGIVGLEANPGGPALHAEPVGGPDAEGVLQRREGHHDVSLLPELDLEGELAVVEPVAVPLEDEDL